jgi:tetratricopeptide (TPR) repeat protein
MMQGKRFNVVASGAAMDGVFDRGFEQVADVVELVAEIGARDYDSAVSDFNQSILLSPQDGEACHGRGDAYKSKGDYDRAIADYEEALRLDPRMQAAKIALEQLGRRPERR